MYVLIPALVVAGLGWAPAGRAGLAARAALDPVPRPMSLIDSVPDQIALPVLIGLGLVAGVVLGLYWRLTNRPDSLDA